MRSISGLLSLIAIKFSNLKVSNSSRNASVIFMVSLILLSMISVSDLAGAQLVSSQDDSSTVTDTPRTNNNTINPKTECNEPIEINNISSSSFDNTNNEDDDGVNAELAFDSDEGTEWSEDRVGAYLEFDIGAIRSICDIEIQWDKGEERSYNFVVSVSENGTKFKDRIRATSSGNSDLPELYSFPDTMAKQVRLTVYGNSEDETASIKEISVNGRDVRKIGQGYKICEELPVAKFVATPSQSGDPPEKAVDGDYTTAWSAEGAGSFLQADVGEVKSICHVSIAWYNGESRQYVFEVSVSKDGINFDQVYEGISSGNSIRPQYYAFSEADARYVRITVFGNDKDNWAGITELSIKGFTPPLPPNNPPVADPKSVSTDMNVPISITLSGSDPEGSILTFNIVDLPKHGQLSSVSSDTVKYTPDKDYSGSDSFTYTVKDSKGVASGKSLVSINVRNNPPVADPKSVSTDMNVPIPITLSGSDPEGSILTFNIVDLPKHGQLSSVSSDTVKYTPDKDYSGSDSFTYTVKDSKGVASSKSLVSINVRNNPPVADPKSVSTDMNVPIPITLSGSDPEGSILTFNIVDLPKHGQLSSVSSDTVKYTPDKDYSGSDSFTYTVKDSKGVASSKSLVSINVRNNPPVADPKSVSTDMNVP